MSTRARTRARLSGRQAECARDVLTTCVLGPALDTGPDADAATRAEVRDAGRALTNLGWPGPAPAVVALDRADAAVVRRAALAALACAAEVLQEEATAAAAEGCDPDLTEPLRELDEARDLLEAVGWSEPDVPGTR